jgi:DNA-binding beta-propeller fold protein YncE
MKWIKGTKEGIVVAGGQGVGNGLSQLSGPFGIIVDRLGTIYVTDYGNHRVMCWSKEARQGIVVVGGYNQLKGPVGLPFDRQNNLYVVDHHNHRIQKFIKMIE